MTQIRMAFRLILAALLLALPVTANAQKFPPLTGRVVDAANLLSPQQEAQLTQLSEEIQKASSRQFVVATIPDLQGYDIADFGYRLGREWKIGQKDANNGILLIVAPNDRKVRIEVGYGLEPIMTDAYSGMIINTIILPKFREKDLAGGIMAGSAAIGEQMKLPLEAAEARAKEEAVKQTSKRGNKKGGVGWLIGLVGFFVVLAVVLPLIFGRRRGRRYRGDNGVANILLWTALDAAVRSATSHGGSGWGGGGGGWSGGGGGFSGGGGSFGGGGASGSW